MPLLTFDFPYSANPSATFTVNGSCSKRELYRNSETLVISGTTTSSTRSRTRTSTVTGLSTPQQPTQRFAFYKDVLASDHNRVNIARETTNQFAVTLSYVDSSTGTGTDTSIGFPLFNFTYNSTTNFEGAFETNIPIFNDLATATTYVTASTDTEALTILENALNYEDDGSDVSPDGYNFEIINCWTYGIWLNDTQPQVNQIYYRNFRAKLVSGEFALYRIDGLDDNKLKMGIKNNAVFYEMQYSTDGNTWTDTDTFPFEFFYRRRINELSPDINTPIGYALTYGNSYIPVFADEETAQGYIDGDVDITQAINWTDISQNYPIINNTADSDDNTEMGEVYTRSFFSQQYICSWQAIQQISNVLFDTSSNIFEDLKKGLQMYGDRFVDSVQSCMFYPIDLTTVYTNVQNQNYIYFGGYQFMLQDGVTVNKIIHPNGYYDFGSFDLHYSFGSKDKPNFRDFSPYTRLFCYLAYIGWVELDSSRYMGHTVDIRYYFDTRTGMCMACLFVQTTEGHVLFDYYQGQVGVSMPVTLTDYSAYANAQIQTLLGGVNDTKGNMGTVFNAGVNMAEKGLMTTGSAMALGSVGLGAVGIGATKTLYGLTQNNINNFNKTKGSSSSMLNMFLPQECMFMFEVQQGTPTPYELELVGYPSNASDLLVNFSGYLEVDSVKLSCSGATDNEKAEIIRQLQSGVYI